MLIGLREVAETGARSRVANHLHVLLWLLTFAVFVAAIVLLIHRQDLERPLLALLGAAVVFQILTLGQPPLWIGALLVLATALLLRRPRQARGA
jgi:hypothetical protein